MAQPSRARPVLQFSAGGLVVDEAGRFQGIVTRTDLLEAIAGEFPDEGE